MSITILLKKLKSAGITIKLHEGKLKVNGAKEQLTTELLTEIKTKKDDIMKFMESIKTDYQPILKVAEQSDYPLSHAQKRIWIFEQMQPDTPVYKMLISYRLVVEINLQALEDTLATLLERHESLRTIFVTNNGEPRQKILAVSDCCFTLQFDDLTSTPDPELAAHTEAENEAARPFDLEKGPLLRVRLIKVGQFDYYLLFSLHHIIFDGLSMENLLNEVYEIYEAFVSGHPNPLQPLTIQYKDYTNWQQVMLSGENLRKQQDFWFGQFSGELPILNLPTSRPRPVTQTYNGDRVGLQLSNLLSMQLINFSRQQKVTQFMFFFSAFNVLLYHYTGQSDLVIGSPIAGREHDDLKAQIGFFVNTLALRTRFSPEQSYLNLLEQIKKDTLQAFENQSYPFDRLVEDLNLIRDPAHSPLFDVMLVKGNEGKSKETVEEERYKNGIPVKIPISKFDLTMSFAENRHGIYLSIEFNTDLFDLHYIEKMTLHFERLLESIITDPQKPVNELEFLSITERNDILHRFNNKRLVHPKDQTLVELFEAVVERIPDVIAVVCQNRQLTYRELNNCCNQLARNLRSDYGVRANQPVGLILEQSEGMIIALLGILKSGGAYVPIDPDYPDARKAYIIKDADLSVLITHSQYVSSLSKYNVATLLLDLYIDKKEYTNNLKDFTINTNDLAYIIYTSGSTGSPKGVLINHSSVVDYFYGVLSRTNITVCKSFGLFSTVVADLGNTIIYGALFTGGTLNVFTKEEVMDPQKVLEADLDCIKIVPSHWKALQTENGLFAANKCLIFGGERLTPDVISLLRSHAVCCDVYNHYGPTETTIGKLIAKIDINDHEAIISLGSPFGNSSVYILSANEKLQPTGIAGEICISGAGLARGYLNQPDLTAEKFVPNPYLEGELMYKTGDLGRWLPGGNIEYLGRRDDQVKIRGYRIELGELENELRSYPGIEIAVVVIQKKSDGEQELAAYFVSSQVLEIKAIRNHLSEIIPTYMLPAHYIQLEKLPLTPNGKVDKSQLPNPAIKPDKANSPLMNSIERQMLRIWELVLDRQGIKLHDNFFELGGHSLKAIQLMAIINKELSLNITPRNILQYPTISSFLDAVVPEKLKKGLLISFNKMNENRPTIFFLPPVIGTSLVYLPIVKHLEKDYNCYGLQNRGFDYAEVFDKSVEKVALSFASEIGKVQMSGQIILCGYSSGVLIAFALTKLFEESGFNVKLVLLDRDAINSGEFKSNRKGFNKDFDHWIGGSLKGLGFNVKQVSRIRKLWFHNLLISTMYRVEGSVCSDILAFESGSNKMNDFKYMDSWSNHTSGILSHVFLKGRHDDVLNPLNSNTIARYILKLRSSVITQ